MELSILWCCENYIFESSSKLGKFWYIIHVFQIESANYTFISIHRLNVQDDFFFILCLYNSRQKVIMRLFSPPVAQPFKKRWTAEMKIRHKARKKLLGKCMYIGKEYGNVFQNIRHGVDDEGSVGYYSRWKAVGECRHWRNYACRVQSVCQGIFPLLVFGIVGIGWEPKIMRLISRQIYLPIYLRISVSPIANFILNLTLCFFSIQLFFSVRWIGLFFWVWF